MKKIINLILIQLTACIAIGASAPTSEEEATISAALDTYFTQVKETSDHAVWNSTAEEFVRNSTNKAMLKKLYEWLMANPVEFRQWYDAKIKSDLAKNQHIRQLLVFYKRAYDEDTVLTLDQCIIGFAMAEFWKQPNLEVFINNYDSLKATNWVYKGYKMHSRHVFFIASTKGDFDAIINASSNHIVEAGLEFYLPLLQKIFADSENTLENAQKAWNAYVRTRRILTPYQTDSKNSNLWATLIANEDAAYVDYKRLKRESN